MQFFSLSLQNTPTPDFWQGRETGKTGSSQSFMQFLKGRQEPYLIATVGFIHEVSESTTLSEVSRDVAKDHESPSIQHEFLHDLICSNGLPPLPLRKQFPVFLPSFANTSIPEFCKRCNAAVSIALWQPLLPAQLPHLTQNHPRPTRKTGKIGVNTCIQIMQHMALVPASRSCSTWRLYPKAIRMIDAPAHLWS